MIAKLRARLSYANVTATLALVLAMGGTAAAASRYLIHSTKQISPSVLKALRGPAGPRALAFSTSRGSPFLLSGIGAPVAQVAVPAGHYAITAHTVIQALAQAPASIGFGCSLRDGPVWPNQNVLDAASFYGPLAATGQPEFFPYELTVSPALTATLDTATATVLWLVCETYRPQGPAYTNTSALAHIVAVQTAGTVKSP